MKFSYDDFYKDLGDKYDEAGRLDEEHGVAETFARWGFQQAKQMMRRKVKEIDERALHEAWGTYEYTKALEKELIKE